MQFKTQVYHNDGRKYFITELCTNKAQFILILHGMKATGVITGWDEGSVQQI